MFHSFIIHTSHSFMKCLICLKRQNDWECAACFNKRLQPPTQPHDIHTSNGIRTDTQRLLTKLYERNQAEARVKRLRTRIQEKKEAIEQSTLQL